MRIIKTSDASRIERTAEITMFLNDARRYEMRSASEQIELCRRAKAGDEKARAELVHCNLLFMFSVCAKYANGNDILDLIGAATIGLLNSIQLFDEQPGVNFWSYAVRGMQDEIMQTVSADKLVVNKSEIRVSAKVAKLRERFYQSAERYPSEDELMALLESEGIDANEYHVKQMSFSSFSDVMGDDDEDTLDLQSRLTTFDFTEILQDPVLAPAVISYILHRINNTTVSGGNPSLIMIDETAPMLENKMFRDNFISGLQEGRKNRQAYMVAFQRANVLDKLGIGDVVRGQAQTILFFRNPAADVSDYEHWKLNPLEMAFIQGKAYPNLKRAVLLSRPVNNESVILNTELGGLGNLLRLFESGRSSVLLAEELYKSYGSAFVEEYLKKNV